MKMKSYIWPYIVATPLFAFAILTDQYYKAGALLAGVMAYTFFVVLFMLAKLE